MAYIDYTNGMICTMWQFCGVCQVPTVQSTSTRVWHRPTSQNYRTLEYSPIKVLYQPLYPKGWGGIPAERGIHENLELLIYYTSQQTALQDDQANCTSGPKKLSRRNEGRGTRIARGFRIPTNGDFAFHTFYDAY